MYVNGGRENLGMSRGEFAYRKLGAEKVERNGNEAATKRTRKELWGTNERGDKAKVRRRLHGGWGRVFSTGS